MDFANPADLSNLNLEFSFTKTDGYTKVKDPSLIYYLPIAKKIIGFIPFSRVLLLLRKANTLVQLVMVKLWSLAQFHMG